MQSDDGKRYEVPVRYGDPLEVVVPRAWYELVALFLSKPLTRTHKPTLLALATAYEGAIGARQQQVLLLGRYPSRDLVSWLDQRIPPAQRPFQLPTRSHGLLPTSQPAPVAAGLSRPTATSPARLGRSSITGLAGLRGSPPVTQRFLGPADARRFGPAGQLPRSPVPGSAVPGPKNRSKPAPAPSKPKPVTPPDGQCEARTRRGTRCQNWSHGARGNVCEMHLDMVAQGKTVLWHKSGQPIRLRKS
jgi:hypothetical protein